MSTQNQISLFVALSICMIGVFIGTITLAQPINTAYSELRWSPDGEYLAGLTDANQLEIRRVDGTVIQTITAYKEATGDRTGVFSFDWSPDSRYIATGGTGEKIFIYDVLTGQVVQSLQAEGYTNDFISFIDWGKNGKLAAYGGSFTLLIWEVETGELTLQIGLGTIISFSWANQSNLLLEVSASNTISILNADKGEITPASRGGFAPQTLITFGIESNLTRMIDRIIWSVDDQYLITTGVDGNVLVWDVHTGKQTRTIAKLDENITSLSLDPSGTVIALTTLQGNAYFYAYETGILISTLTRPSQLRTLAWSPDGETIAMGGGYVRSYWDVYVDPDDSLRTVSQQSNLEIIETPVVLNMP